MPSFDEHTDKARTNIEFFDSFVLKRSNDWAVTVMFYTCVHLVESLMFLKVNELRGEKQGGSYEAHCSNHDVRSRQLKALFDQIHFQYSQLEKAAKMGRYKAAYKFRDEEVIFNYVNFFVPIMNFFNSYCRNRAEFTSLSSSFSPPKS